MSVFTEAEIEYLRDQMHVTSRPTVATASRTWSR
jgi:hypothetical protein